MEYEEPEDGEEDVADLLAVDGADPEKFIDIVLMKPPGPEANFIAALQSHGQEITDGRWIRRGDGTRAFRIPLATDEERGGAARLRLSAAELSQCRLDTRPREEAIYVSQRKRGDPGSGHTQTGPAARRMIRTLPRRQGRAVDWGDEGGKRSKTAKPWKRSYSAGNGLDFPIGE
jgi:hypothetical protein